MQVPLPAWTGDLRSFQNAIEKHSVEWALKQAQWNVAEAARLLGIKRTTLAMKAKKHGMVRPAEEYALPQS